MKSISTSEGSLIRGCLFLQKRRNKLKEFIKKSIPYVFTALLGTNLGEAIRMSTGSDASERILSFMEILPEAFRNLLPSLHPFDFLIGAAVAGVFALIIQIKRMDAKKYRQGVEYGSARWGTRKDIQPFINPDFQQNVILT